MANEDPSYEDLKLPCCNKKCKKTLSPKSAALSFISGSIFQAKRKSSDSPLPKLKDLGPSDQQEYNLWIKEIENKSLRAHSFNRRGRYAIIDDEDAILYAFSKRLDPTLASSVTFYIKCKKCGTVCKYIIE